MRPSHPFQGQPLGPTYWPSNEPYREHHPFFNRSVLATIHIRISEQLLKEVRSTNIENSISIFAPPVLTLFLGTYVPAEMLFNNGNVEIATPVGIKLKGYSSRRYGKKSWKIKFTDEKVYGLNRFGLKANSQEKTSQRGLHESDLLRAAGVPSCRNSHANLFINDMYFGLFWLEETLDDTWIKSRFDTNKGSFYKIAGAMLQNLGPDPETYKKYPPFNLPPNPLFDLGSQAYELKYGKNDTYQDLAALCQISNVSQAEFEKRLPQIFDADLFIRSVIVITAVVNIDCFSVTGNNYMLYNPKQKDYFKFITSDFDLAFATLIPANFPGPGNTTIPQALLPPLIWGTTWPNHFLPEILNALPNKFTSNILKSQKYQAQFLAGPLPSPFLLDLAFVLLLRGCAFSTVFWLLLKLLRQTIEVILTFFLDYKVFVEKVFQLEPMWNRWKTLETFLAPYILKDQWSPSTLALPF